MEVKGQVIGRHCRGGIVGRARLKRRGCKPWKLPFSRGLVGRAAGFTRPSIISVKHRNIGSLGAVESQNECFDAKSDTGY